MKTIRLLYPDYVSGGLDEYYFGAHLMQHILPNNPNQKELEVPIEKPNDVKKPITDGIYAKEEVLQGLQNAKTIIEQEAPDKIITIGGNCIVSLPAFDYLHNKYEKTGIIWIDAHPDVSRTKDGYPYAHAMVLAALLGNGEQALMNEMKSPSFTKDELLYIGLQDLHDYQKEYLDSMKVNYKIQTEDFVSNEEITLFTKQFDHVLVHFDVDVLDEHFFHSTYFANPELSGDGSSGGKMKMEKLSSILQLIQKHTDVVGFTIAEYLPFDEYRLHKMFSKMHMFTD